MRGAGAGSTAHLVPEHIRSAVRAQLAEISDPARQLLQAAALLGETFALRDVALVQSVTTLSLLPALDEVMAASLVRFRGDRLAFRSPEVHRALGDDLSGPLRRMLRGGVTAPGDTAGEPPSGYAPGTESQAFAQHMMASLFLAQDSLSRPLSPSSAAALRKALMAELAAREGDMDTAAEADRVVGLFREDEREQRARASAILAAHGTSPAAVVAAAVLSNLEWTSGRLDEGLRWGREALRLAGDVLPESWRPYPGLTMAMKLIHIGELTESGAVLARIRQEAQRLGNRKAIADSMITQGRLLIAEGRTAEAEAELVSGVSLAERMSANNTVTQGVSLLAVTSLWRGQVNEAVDYLWRARMENVSDQAAFPSIRRAWTDFLVASTQLDPRNAIDLLAHHAGLLTKPLLFVGDNGAAARIVRLARVSGEFSLAATVVRTTEWLAARNAARPALAATAEQARGVLHDDADALEYAAREHRCPWASASASEDLGLLLSRRGRGGPAQRHLRTAMERYADIGAEAEVARVRVSLLASGSTDGGAAGHRPPTPTAPAVEQPAPPTPAMVPGAAAPEPLMATLTEAEQRVALLVAEGMTNQQVARLISRSPHTVNYHLRQIFRKLDMSSRVELARHFRDGLT
ncbi:LuxR C-terminal-related transcriptional regulator [Streptomyces sp. Je 1-4]|uniref:LuxR family transcriptional regulator n=1 Tax=Streptomyces TaxID=1883 RepID=UPI0021D9EE17|nr:MULTISPECIES: LuxR family transcriptional regulator [unclassified Streptomyces]UYB38798.1 LuxR C-terminal-related transcriptional regulator [Streptomyces sp. Je 1-4]UZQ34781.1 LuxR C-terminal-related transcriptional regulator [Streptomyces sp. Je 1-4] [Streptomyces sp. Je 1-4 4N24]UZQ42199.1 LuxR C-terminal-related transcriptional regulator [Streptomyces sp. Je 1-4] [Streptomyces sp. Je 1-4 4N24_ara]